MKKKELEQRIEQIYKYARRTPYTMEGRVQQHVRVFWKLEDLVDQMKEKKRK